jgi:ATP-dependent DNA helicase RecG
LLASFFVNIGRADTLGSGMRNLYKYTGLYSHAEPVLSEGDIFEIRIPLQNRIEADEEANREANEANCEANREANNEANPDANWDIDEEQLYEEIISEVIADPEVTQAHLSEMLHVSRSTIQRATKALTEKGRLERVGGTRGWWKVNDSTRR